MGDPLLAGRVLLAAAPFLGGLKGWVIEPRAVEGSLARGLVVRDLRIVAPGFEARIAEVRLRAKLLPMLRRRVVLEELELLSPTVVVAPRARGGSDAASGLDSAARASWEIDVVRWRVEAGTLIVPKAPPGYRRFERLRAAGSVERGTALVERASASAREVRLSASGHASLRARGGRWQGWVEASGLDVSRLFPALAAARLSRVSGRARAEGAGAEGRARVALTETGGLRAEGEVEWDARGAKADARVTGTDLTARLSARAPRGGPAEGSWSAAAGPRAAARWLRGASAALAVSSGTFSGRTLRGGLTAAGARAGEVEIGRVDARFVLSPGRALVKASVPRFDRAAPGLTLTGIELALDAAGSLAAPRGSARATIAGGTFRGEPLGSAEASFALDGRLARIERFEWRLPEGRVTLAGALPLRRSKAGRVFTLRARAQDVQLGRYARAPREVELRRPRVDGDLELRSERGGWVVVGTATLAADRLAYDRAGVAFERPFVEFAADGRRLRVRSASPAVSGELSRAGPALAFKAERVKFALKDGAKGEVSADVALRGSWRAPALTGEVFVHKAEYRPPKRKRSKPEPATEPARPRSGVALDLRVRADGNVWYKDRQASIEFKGDVRARGTQPALFGTVEAVRGSVSYFGRQFKIDRAKAVFSGEAPPDPALDAVSEFVEPRSNARVRLGLTGTAKAPKLELSSEPPMDQRDILSFLAFGRPLYEVGERRDPATAEQAATMVADYLAQGLGRYLPVDLFRVKLTENRKADVSVGRYVARNLFVSYGQTFEREGQKRVSADYKISDQWSLETQSFGEGRYVIDLLFNYGIR